MSFGSYDSGARYRRLARERTRRNIITMILLGVFAFSGYWYGGSSAKSRIVALDHDLQTMAADKAELEKQVTSLRAQLQTAGVHYKQLEEKYAAEVPQGDLKKLTDLARKRLNEGANLERLEFVIQSAAPPRNCNESETKRFVIRTPVYQGPKSAVTIGDGLLAITGEGISALNEEGKPEAWYDPGKAVTVRFTGLGGKNFEKTEVLPMHHSMVINDREYRFTISQGTRSFAKVTYDSCAYP